MNDYMHTQALWKDKGEQAICYPGDIPALVEVVAKTPTRHRWLKGHTIDWLWGQACELRRHHGVVISGIQRLQVG